MNNHTPPAKLSEREFSDLLALTIDNQRAEGYVLTEAEIAIVRARLRKQHGLD